MKTQLYIVFLLISISSFAQNEKLTIDFQPSFLENSKLIIKNVSNKYSVTLQTEYFTEKCPLPDTLFDDLEVFLKGYNFAKKGSIDTMAQKKVIENGDTVVHYQSIIGLDGINVYGKFVKNNKIKTFKFWSPNKVDLNSDLIEILFKIMYRQFKNQKTINYLEQLEQYFDFGLGLRKLQDNPLMYKLYGSISANERNELYKFFDSLPVNKKVYIDMSNFNDMGTMFDKDFLDLSESHKLISWTNCSESAKNTLKRAKIKRNRYK